MTPGWMGGRCTHDWETFEVLDHTRTTVIKMEDICARCGARRPTPESGQ